MTLDEFAASLGMVPAEDGRFWSPDADRFIGREEVQVMMADYVTPGYDFLGADGRYYMVTSDRGWNDPSAPARYGLTAADTALAPKGSSPNWLPGDRGVLYDKAPRFNSSSIFDFGPILLPALFTAGAALGPASGATAGGVLSDAAIADIVAAEGGFSALPSAGMTSTAGAALPATKTIATGAGKGALTGGIMSGLQGGNPVKGALTGAVTGGATSAAAPFVSGLTPYTAVNQAIGSAGLGALTSGLRGSNPVTGAVGGALNSGVNSASRAVWNAATNSFVPANRFTTGSEEYEQPTAVSGSEDTNMDKNDLGADDLDEVQQWASQIPGGLNDDGTINWAAIDENISASESDGGMGLGTIDEGPGVLDFSNAANSLGLQQMGQAAGLRGDALARFVASGGTQGSTRVGGGGIGTGAGIPFGASGGAASATGGSSTVNVYNQPDTGVVPGIFSGLTSVLSGLAALFGASRDTDTGAGVLGDIAADQWNYYKQNYQPLETGLIKQATEAGSPEEFARARGAANADVTGAFDTARKQTLSRMQSFGINPSSPAYQSTAASTDIAEGAAKAGALTMADRNTRNLAYSKGLDVVGIGRGIPAQSAASAANAANAATAASRNEFLQNQARMQSTGYGLNTIGKAVDNWFGKPAVNPLAGNYQNWGNDEGYAKGGMVIPAEYRRVAARAVATENIRRMKKRKAQSMTPHMKNRFAHGGSVGMRGMGLNDASMMGEMRGPGTETSDSIPATIDGQKAAALSSGEFVVSAEAVDLTGEEILEAINQAGLQKRGLEPRGQEAEQMDAGMLAYKHGGRVSRYACGGLARR